MGFVPGTDSVLNDLDELKEQLLQASQWEARYRVWSDEYAGEEYSDYHEEP